MTHYVTCVRPLYAELTAGTRYTVYGRSENGVIIRNDFGLLLTYGQDFFH